MGIEKEGHVPGTCEVAFCPACSVAWDGAKQRTLADPAHCVGCGGDVEITRTADPTDHP